MLVEAFGEACKETSLPIELHLVGAPTGWEYTEKIKRIATELGVRDRVFFDGLVEDMASVWAQTDIAVVPSPFEAFGRCAVEAMMAGCLVIGNSTAGTAEIIAEEAGLLSTTKTASRLLPRNSSGHLKPRGSSVPRAGRTQTCLDELHEQEKRR